MASTSWVIKHIETGEVVMETFDPKIVRHLNTARYVAIPIAKYLADINHYVRNTDDV